MCPSSSYASGEPGALDSESRRRMKEGRQVLWLISATRVLFFGFYVSGFVGCRGQP